MKSLRTRRHRHPSQETSRITLKQPRLLWLLRLLPYPLPHGALRRRTCGHRCAMPPPLTSVPLPSALLASMPPASGTENAGPWSNGPCSNGPWSNGILGNGILSNGTSGNGKNMSFSTRALPRHLMTSTPPSLTRLYRLPTGIVYRHLLNARPAHRHTSPAFAHGSRRRTSAAALALALRQWRPQHRESPRRPYPPPPHVARPRSIPPCAVAS